MGNWDFRLVDYWDQTTSAINRNALRLSKLSEPEREAACGQIRDTVRGRARDLADEQLLQAAVSMVDDLYKYVNDEVWMAAALFEYLDAFGRTLTQAVRERGYVIRYVVENQFSGAEYLMLGPFDVFPRVFNAAGLVYICPQQLGLRLMQHDGIAASEYPRAIAQYITEARHIGDRIAIKCHDEGQHCVFLEADYQQGTLDIALRGSGSPGVLSIFRDDAPVAGSEVYLTSLNRNWRTRLSTACRRTSCSSKERFAAVAPASCTELMDRQPNAGTIALPFRPFPIRAGTA